MKNYLILFLKGMGMGVANVIPGVSGGTIALITEIYEDLINSLKSFDKKAFQLLLSFNIKEFITHTNFYFLTWYSNEFWRTNTNGIIIKFIKLRKP